MTASGGHFMGYCRRSFLYFYADHLTEKYHGEATLFEKIVAPTAHWDYDPTNWDRCKVTLREGEVPTQSAAHLDLTRFVRDTHDDFCTCELADRVIMEFDDGHHVVYSAVIENTINVFSGQLAQLSLRHS